LPQKHSKTTNIMTLNRTPFIWFTRLALSAVMLAGVLAHAKDSKSDVAGTWTWTAPGRNGGPDRTNTLALQIESSKLTGKLTAPGRGGQINETPIAEGKLDGGGISFLVVREFNGNSVTNKYTGKIEGEKIHGTIQFTRNGEEQSRDWEASRATSTK
jgi:hypothetical protein